MPRLTELPHHLTLDDYAAHANFAAAVQELRAEAALVRPRFGDRTIWMVTGHAAGSHTAEMVASNVSLLRGLGIGAEWLVMETDRPDFLALCRRLDALMHGAGDPTLSPDHRPLFESVSRQNANWMRRLLRPGDLVIAHSVDTLGVGALLGEAPETRAIWWCFGGLDEHTPQTRAAWSFLKPFATRYERSVFVAAEYIPAFLTGTARVIVPGLDPLNHKNRELSIHKLSGILCNAAVLPEHGTSITPPFPEPVRRLRPDGEWEPASERGDIGLLHRPIVSQISRWDRRKGFRPLLEGFVKLKRGLADGISSEDRYRKTLQAARLVLAGPNPGADREDPEGRELLREIAELYSGLSPELQDDIAILMLTTTPAKCAAFTVNALQRCSSVVVQNSLQEGFGFEATEAMWKRIPVLVSRAFGLRLLVRDGMDGRVVCNPEDSSEIARTLGEMLADPHARNAWGRSARRRVRNEFLVFAQLQQWLAMVAEEGVRLSA